ncbi:MAG: RecX family transcriptional regulator [Bacilli bacterium]|nr:RecX family transcriptional regulator [Bacilli bacterium]
MPSAVTSKEISIIRIAHNKKSIKILFSTQEEIKIDIDTFTDFFLFEGKKLSRDEISQIKKRSEVASAQQYALSLVARHSYTEMEIRRRLRNKKVDNATINSIIKRLLSNNLINDSTFADDYMEYARHRGYGPKRVKSDLLKKGISQTIIDNLPLTSLDSEYQIDRMAKKFLHGKKFPNQKAQNDAVFAFLYRNGFSQSKAIAIVQNLPQIPHNLVMENLHSDLLKAKKRYQSKYTGLNLRQRLIYLLEQKGYNYEDISLVLED